MKRYIPAEELIAEIKRYKQEAAIARFDNAGENADYFQGKVELCDDLTHIITSLQQEQPKRKLVKVRCVFPFDETWEKNKIYTCEVWHHGDLNRNFWDVYYDYGKDPKYVQFPTIELLNEEFAIIQEEPQVIPEQPEVDYNKFEKLFYDFCERNKGHHITSHDACMWFWELGLNARKE